MQKRNFIPALAVLFLSLLAAFVPLCADEPRPGVARVSLIRGDVSTQRGDSGDWVATVVNSPLVIGDTISTGSGSRTELQLDHANILRLDQQTQAKIADLTPSHIQVQLSQGQADYVILRHSDVDVEIDTPNVAIHPFAEGIYRLEVNSDSETQLIVRRGEAEVSTSEGGTSVQMEQLISIEGTDSPEYQVVEAPGRDDWDGWNQSRDREILQAESWQHTNGYYVGANDLDRYGHWVDVPGYGWGWSPYVDDPFWAPYRAGRWVWEPYWGWTWVSYEPWGWAPYHYGRWFLYGDSWVWWPGPVQPAFVPVYAPAYVSFFGFGFGGRNWSFGFGFGYNSVGWLPVGPSDYYYPWSGYRNSYSAVNITNITNVTNITTNVTNIQSGAVPPLASPQQPVRSNVQAAMSNAKIRQALTTASTQDFVSGNIPRKPQPVEAAALRQAQLIRGTVPAVPTQASLRPADRTVNSTSLPKRPINNQRFITVTQPPAGPRPFNERAAEIRQMVQQRAPAASNLGQGEARQSANQLSQATASSGRQDRPGWRRFGSPETAKVPKTYPAPSPRQESNREQRTLNPPTQTAAPSRREENPPAANPRRSATQNAAPNQPGESTQLEHTQPPEHAQAGEPSHPASRATRPGWHRFGEEGAGAQGKSEPHKEQPAERKPPRKEE